jgi:hypothetical protein
LSSVFILSEPFFSSGWIEKLLPGEWKMEKILITKKERKESGE